MWGQPKISSCCLCVWCKSKELGGKESGVRGGKIPNINGGNLLRRFSVTYRKFLDRVAFRILSNINDGSSLRKYVEHLQMIRLMMIILMVFYTFGELVLWGFRPILRNGQKQPLAVFYKKDVLRNFARFKNSQENTCAQRNIFLRILRTF